MPAKSLPTFLSNLLRFHYLEAKISSEVQQLRGERLRLLLRNVMPTVGNHTASHILAKRLHGAIDIRSASAVSSQSDDWQLQVSLSSSSFCFMSSMTAR